MTELGEVLGVLEQWNGRALTEPQRAVYVEALIGFPIDLVADALVSWQRRVAPGTKMLSPVEVANACREMQRGSWQQQKDGSPEVADLGRAARTPKSKAAFAFIRAMLDERRTPATKREAAIRFLAIYGDYTQSTCYQQDCPGNVWKGGGCVSHVRREVGPWVAMAEGAL